MQLRCRYAIQPDTRVYCSPYPCRDIPHIACESSGWLEIYLGGKHSGHDLNVNHAALLPLRVHARWWIRGSHGGPDVSDLELHELGACSEPVKFGALGVLYDA